MSAQSDDRTRHGNGRFAPEQHAEGDVELAPPVHGYAHMADAMWPEDDWTGRPIHDLMTQAAPDLAARTGEFAASDPEPPAGADPVAWRTDIEKVRGGFAAMDAFDDRPAPTRAAVEAGLAVIAADRTDFRLAAALAPSIAPALDRFAREAKAYPADLEEAEWPAMVDRMAAGFRAARVLVDAPPSDRHDYEELQWTARQGIEAFTERYFALWS